MVAGSTDLAVCFETFSAEIVYERPLPDNLAEEIYRLRQRMEMEIGKEDARHRNIKTGRGGMVDVEFVAQYLQLLHGRDKPSLRCRNTLDTLAGLLGEGLLAADDCEKLTSGYKFLRRLENKLRLVHDQSVNELTSDPASLTKLARHLGYEDSLGQPEKLFLDQYAETTQTIREIFNRILQCPGDSLDEP